MKGTAAVDWRMINAMLFEYAKLNNSAHFYIQYLFFFSVIYTVATAIVYHTTCSSN